MTDPDFLNEQQVNRPPQRPLSLTMLCVLSFGWKALSFINVVDIFILIQGSFNEFILDYAKAQSMPELEERIKLLSNIHWSYPCLFLVVIVVAFIGVLNMWNLQKKGFHIYTLATIAELIIANAYKVGNGMPDMIIAGFFVALYALQLRNMVRE